MRGLYEGVEKKYLEEIVKQSEANSKKYGESKWMSVWFI